jgi:hypothetical protein
MVYWMRRLRAACLPLVAVAVLAGMALSVPGAAAAPAMLPVMQDEPTPTPQILTSDSLVPCNLRGKHDVDPRIVEMGSDVTVSVDYSYNCITEGTRQIDMVLVVEDTGALRIDRDRAGQQPLENLKDGLQRFVIAIDPTNDSRVGMVKYASNWTGAPPIGSGEDHFQAFLNALNQVRGALGGCANPGSALRAASGMVNSLGKPDPTDPPSLMIIVDAGAPPCSGVPPSQEAGIGNACDAAKAEQVTVVLVALRASNGRLRGCNTPGWYYRSSSDTGSDLPGIFEDIRDRTLRDQKPRETLYSDFFDTLYWEYVFGSGAPRDPDTFFGDLIWSEQVPQVPRGNYRYSYRMKATNGPLVGPVTLDPGPALQLIFSQVSEEWFLPQKEVCIHRAGRMEQDCGQFILRLTQEALPTAVPPTETPFGPTPTDFPTETSEPPATETPGPATETPEPPATETATLEPPNGPMIYLPMAKKD